MKSDTEHSPATPGQVLLSEIRERLRAIYSRPEGRPLNKVERENAKHLPRNWKIAPRQQLLKSLDPAPRSKGLAIPHESLCDHLRRHRSELTSAPVRRNLSGRGRLSTAV